jgi:hypothetical protein
MPFWRWYLASLVFSQVLFAVLNIVPALILEPGRFHTDYYLHTFPLGAAAFPVVLAPLVALYVLCWPVRVAPAGLRAANAWGRFATIRWGSITAVKPVPVPLIPFARIFSTETQRVLWVPLFMRDYRHYATLVAESAGEEHPLARELLKRLEES